MDFTVLIFTAAVLILVMIALAFFTLLIKDKSKIKEIWFLYWMDFFIMGTILIPAYIGGITFTIVIAILSTISLLEYLNLHEGLLPFIIKAACIVFGFFVFLLAHFYDYLIVYASIPLAAGVLLIISIFTKKEKNPFLNVSSSLLGLIYVSIFYSHIIFIRKMENGFLLIFFLYVIAEINDAFAYFWGKWFGKKKIFPHISPNKTYAGFFGGILTTLAFAMVLNHFITQFSAFYSFVAASIIVIFTILGDMLSSKIKRAFNVKDFSHLIPKVGGILDAYDALIFVSPVFFYFVNFTKDKL